MRHLPGFLSPPNVKTCQSYSSRSGTSNLKRRIFSARCSGIQNGGTKHLWKLRMDMANGYRESGILHPLQQPKIRYSTCRIIPLSKYLVTPIYKPFRPFIRGITPFRGLTITMVINHLLTGMILQVPPFHGPVSFPLPKRVSGFKEGEAWEKIFQF